jgi:hypothetical protein
LYEFECTKVEGPVVEAGVVDLFGIRLKSEVAARPFGEWHLRSKLVTGSAALAL